MKQLNSKILLALLLVLLALNVIAAALLISHSRKIEQLEDQLGSIVPILDYSSENSGESIYKAYGMIIDQSVSDGRQYGWNSGYALLDLDSDNIPELILSDATSHADCGYKVYKYNSLTGDCELIDKIYGNFLQYNEEKNAIYTSFSSSGVTATTENIYDSGKFISEHIYTDYSGMGEAYTGETEPMPECLAEAYWPEIYDYNDRKPLSWKWTGNRSRY